MRACWLNLGEGIDYAKHEKYGIAAPCFDARDDRLRQPVNSKHFLDDVLAHVSGKPRLYVAQSWYPELNAVQFAQKAHQLVLEVNWQGNPAVDLDIEKGSPLSDATYVDFVLAALKEWRRLRPSRETSWTLEGFQGGLFNGKFTAVQEIVSRNVTVVPQFYTGDMRPHRAGVLQNLMDYGFPRERLSGFYDAAVVQEPWDGWLFVQSRLP